MQWKHARPQSQTLPDSDTHSSLFFAVRLVRRRYNFISALFVFVTLGAHTNSQNGPCFGRKKCTANQHQQHLKLSTYVIAVHNGCVNCAISLWKRNIYLQYMQHEFRWRYFLVQNAKRSFRVSVHLENFSVFPFGICWRVQRLFSILLYYSIAVRLILCSGIGNGKADTVLTVRRTSDLKHNSLLVAVQASSMHVCCGCCGSYNCYVCATCRRVDYYYYYYHFNKENTEAQVKTGWVIFGGIKMIKKNPSLRFHALLSLMSMLVLPLCTTTTQIPFLVID